MNKFNAVVDDVDKHNGSYLQSKQYSMYNGCTQNRFHFLSIQSKFLSSNLHENYSENAKKMHGFTAAKQNDDVH